MNKNLATRGIVNNWTVIPTGRGKASFLNRVTQG